MTRNKRTGLVPGKKFFTSVGGVGSRNIAMHNKILSQASMPRPAPGPTETNKPQVEIKLFNTFSLQIPRKLLLIIEAKLSISLTN